jgi:hypothetical protein
VNHEGVGDTTVQSLGPRRVKKRRIDRLASRKLRKEGRRGDEGEWKKAKSCRR